MAQAQGLGRRYIKAFFKGFFVAVPVTVTFLDRVACVARVEGASMQVFLEISFVYQEIKRCLFTDNSKPSLNPGGREASDVVLLNHWSIRNYDVQRGDIVSLVSSVSFWRSIPFATYTWCLNVVCLFLLRSPRNPEQKIIKRVIALEGDIIKTIGYKKKYVKVPHGHIWVEGDHHGHSFDSNAFGPLRKGVMELLLWAPGLQPQMATVFG
ncbi:mitochondrial inner membrane protease subunit 2 isoform X2 [Taeniopygia guttata]|uniref:mitochondrial inner membrane protease subunit 2 isoform X2 n=1 Tax=Taeniopygia guttata TaxID=59729 RepID=UPI003BB8FBAA